MAKPIPKHIEKLGKIWVMINEAYRGNEALERKRYEKARSLLWELVGKDDFIRISKDEVVMHKGSIDGRDKYDIDMIKAAIHKSIKRGFDESLYDSMRRGQAWSWDKIVADYKGVELVFRYG